VEGQSFGAAARQAVAPDGVGDAIGREDPVGVDDQQGQKRPLMPRGHGQDAAIRYDLERAQDPELHPPHPRAEDKQPTEVLPRPFGSD
jgi:hypothetical protein